MFRAAPRLIARPASLRAFTSPPARRFLSTAPPAQQRRSWKSLVARLGIAGAVIYYYNTNELFVEEPRPAANALPTADADIRTIESIAAEREKRRAIQAQLDKQKEQEREAAAKKVQDADAATSADQAKGEGQGGLEGLEEEAGQQGAFNPETGEINWDCPCLGGMADGPCGEEFRAAFSCFVFSQEEPKGMDCVDKFKGMQNCFREHPDVYGSELESDAHDDDDDDDDNDNDDSANNNDQAAPPSTPAKPTTPAPSSNPKQPTEPAAQAKPSPQPSSKPQSPEPAAEKTPDLGLVPKSYRPKETKKEASETESAVPKAAFDATDDEARGEEKRPEVSERK